MISKRRLAKGILAGPLLAACLWPVAGSAQSRVIDGCARGATSKLVLNVKDKGARGDGKTNDTAAIQAVLDKAAGTGGTVLVPDGTYMVDATVRLYPRHDTMLQLSQGATLKVIPNGATHYGVIAVAAPNVIVDGGTLEGDRDQHQGTAGEYGYGVHVLAGAENATIRGVTARKMWG
ncbi:MAG: glycosyl hydrolase family 28-related protein [Hyphomicrobium sp.]